MKTIYSIDQLEKHFVGTSAFTSSSSGGVERDWITPLAPGTADEDADAQAVYERLYSTEKEKLNDYPVDPAKGRIDRSKKMNWISRRCCERGFSQSEALALVKSYAPDCAEKYGRNLAREVARAYGKGEAEMDVQQPHDLSGQASEGWGDVAEEDIRDDWRDLVKKRGIQFDDTEIEPPAAMCIRDTEPGYSCTGATLGTSQAGKSLWEQHRAVRIAIGQPVFERPVRQTAGTIFILGEGKQGFKRRLQAVKQAHGLADRHLPIAIMQLQGDLFDSAVQDKLISDIRLFQRACKEDFGIEGQRVVLDTITQLFLFENENANAEWAKVTKIKDRIAQELDARVIGVHHLGKNKDQGSRGGSSYTGNVEFVTVVNCDRDELTGKVSNQNVAISKLRDHEAGPVGRFSTTMIILGWNQYGDPYGGPELVEHLDLEGLQAPSEAKTVSGPNKRQRESIQFIDRMMAQVDGEDCCDFDDGPGVRMASLEELVKEQCPVDVSSDTHPSHQKRNHWNRIRRFLKAGKFYRIGEEAGEEFAVKLHNG